MYALVIDGRIVAQFAELPAKHWVPETDTTGHYEPVTVANAATYGYLPVVRDPRPSDTAMTTWDRTTTITATEVTYGWVERPKTAEELDADDRQAKRVAVGQAVTTLRQWADDAAGVNVTNGNNNAVTQTMATRLGVFFDRFADLIEAQYLDRN